jgi:hypothetical protein
MPPLNAAFRKIGSGIIGCVLRDSITRKIARATAATVNAPVISGEVQPLSPPSISA